MVVDVDVDVGATRSLIREAKGTKSYDTLELCARMILFRPTYAIVSPQAPGSVSSIHALMAPYLLRLKGCEDSKALGRLTEVLSHPNYRMLKDEC